MLDRCQEYLNKYHPSLRVQGLGHQDAGWWNARDSRFKSLDPIWFCWYIYISYIMINDLIKKDQGLGVELVKLVKPENFDEFPTILGIFGEFWALQALETPSADWRHATVAWLRRAELFAPPLLPKMRGGKDEKVGASGGRCGFLEHQLIPVLRCWNHPHMTLYGFALGGWAVTSYATCTLLWQWVMLVTRLYVLKWEHNTPKSFPDDPNWWT